MAALFPDWQPGEHAAHTAAKEDAFRRSVARMEPLPGLLDVLDWVDAVGCVRAVVTNARRENTDLMLGGLGLRERFSVVVIGDELTFGKPHPFPYLSRLQRTGGTADHALAFKDSLSGIRSEAAAGIQTVGMLTGLPETMPRNAGAHSVAADFRDPTLWDLLRSRLARVRFQA
jgi:beta-phosphoglucomutase